ncbi:DNA mismatch repair endonuclease MutL [Lutimonas saemankumensis]|uniref:DNA mismatch repair endonuclease MutL n=1 Tax=Lutimonas saemankumensis TaxID=483016 RepID=UPI001CD7357C|nr:DNA mismatch repair endonuclease MutL [Lutimonas saemankumensis]MCA0932088.1 DNA mismatch repair endonuclease MutL [Lutimonas saemankumensis]
MSDIIRLLPDNVANQIAAGEVVQRPASVVKELMENAVDAGAKNIKLIIKDAGKTLIQVIDDGAGMSAGDARMAFERHATSKIKKAEDLFNLSTNGFRGEALASIAAISHVHLKTKTSEDELGTEIKINGGEILTQQPANCSKGSVFEVKNLFYNIPARRSFLKSNTIETRHIIDAFQRIAFTYPHISFSMVHNENEVFKLPKGKSTQWISNSRQRIVAIMGKATNEKLVPIKEDTDILKIKGFVTKPSFAKKKKGEQFFFVNNRFIKNPYLNHAVMNAYDGLLQPGYHPSYFLFLEVPAESVDVNIHPTKTEVKFDNDRDLYAIIRSTIKHSLGQYNVAPVLDFNRDAELDTPYSFKDKAYTSEPSIEVDQNYNPFKSENQYQGIKRHEKNSHWEALYLSDHPEKELIENITVDLDNISQELFDESEESTSFKTFQVQSKYIASSIKSGMVLIDQNAAHQRIIYEEYLAKITMEGLGHQQLLFPLSISISKIDIPVVKQIQQDLKSAGFHISKIEDEALILDAIPTTISEKEVINILETLIDNFKNEVPESSFSQIDMITKSLAKSLAIKPGTILNNKEQENILNSLFSCKEPNYSPFGKKTFITLSLDDLEEKFNS